MDHVLGIEIPVLARSVVPTATVRVREQLNVPGSHRDQFVDLTGDPRDQGERVPPDHRVGHHVPTPLVAGEVLVGVLVEDVVEVGVLFALRPPTVFVLLDLERQPSDITGNNRNGALNRTQPEGGVWIGYYVVRGCGLFPVPPGVWQDVARSPEFRMRELASDLGYESS